MLLHERSQVGGDHLDDVAAGGLVVAHHVRAGVVGPGVAHHLRTAGLGHRGHGGREAVGPEAQVHLPRRVDGSGNRLDELQVRRGAERHDGTDPDVSEAGHVPLADRKRDDVRSGEPDSRPGPEVRHGGIQVGHHYPGVPHLAERQGRHPEPGDLEMLTPGRVGAAHCLTGELLRPGRMWWPPSTGRKAPVMSAESSDARNMTALEMVSGASAPRPGRADQCGLLA